MNENYLALWDSLYYEMSGYKKINFSFFNEDNGYNEADRQHLREMQVNEIIELSLGHYVIRLR